MRQNNKMEQKLTAASIYHDLQKGVYYRIDKRTGRSERAHKNGQILQTFKLDVSGSDYKKRRQEEGVPSRPFLRKKVVLRNQRPTQVASEKFFSPYQQITETRPSPSNHLQPIRARSNLNSQRMKSQQSQSHFVTNFQPIRDSPQKSESLMRQSTHINSILHCYSKLNAMKVNQNHCWLDKAAGTVIAAPLVNSRGFRQTKNMIYQPLSGLKKERSQVRAISQQSQEQRCGWQRQLSKQKHMFLQFHPDLQQRQNAKILSQHVQRKKNIKKLQELFLQQASKVTSQIYT